MLALRALVGGPFRIDQASGFSLQGNLVLGPVLSFVAVWFHQMLSAGVAPGSGSTVLRA